MFPTQICPTARICSKRSISVEGVGGHVLRGPAFKYLPCCKRLQKIFSSAGRDTILFNIIWSRCEKFLSVIIAVEESNGQDFSTAVITLKNFSHQLTHTAITLYLSSYGALYAFRSTLRMCWLRIQHNCTSAQKPDRVTLFTQHLAIAPLVPNPTVVRPLTKKYCRACGHCPCSPVKDIHQHHDTLIYEHMHMHTLCHCMSPTTPACKHSACLQSMLLYEVQGSNVSMHAMLECMQQAGITYEMPAPYKLACTHRRETHWCCQAGIDSLSSGRQSRENH